MFRITNISNNPLPLSDGTRIAPGDSRKVETVEKREKDYEKRNWLSIFEEEVKESKPAEPTAVKPTDKPEVKK